MKLFHCFVVVTGSRGNELMADSSTSSVTGAKHGECRLLPVDVEAIYSYEGTREINALVVGRAITGFGAFV
jgi:hypothetical protein